MIGISLQIPPTPLPPTFEFKILQICESINFIQPGNSFVPALQSEILVLRSAKHQRIEAKWDTYTVQ